MTPKEQAEKLYDDAYRRWCYELSHEKNVATAKDIAIYMCNLILKRCMLYEEQFDVGRPEHHRSYWDEVIKEIQKLRK